MLWQTIHEKVMDHLEWSASTMSFLDQRAGFNCSQLIKETFSREVRFRTKQHTHLENMEALIGTTKGKNRELSRDQCDLVIQGAVVLACGGGGPLHFARHILEELNDEDTAKIQAPEKVKKDAWMTMIALVGTPSKVREGAYRSTCCSSVSSSRRGSLIGDLGASSPTGQAPMNVFARALAQRMESRLGHTSSVNHDAHSSRIKQRQFEMSSFEVVKKVQRVTFLTPSLSYDLEDEENPCPCNAASNTFKYLEKQCQIRSNDKLHYNRYENFDKFSYILTGELGAVNMAIALYLSAVEGVAVVDCDGAGRSVPLVNQITYADRFSVSPTAIMSPQPGPEFDNIASTLLDFPCGKEKMVEEVAAALISDEDGPFHPYIGYGTYVITGEQMGDVPVFGSYSMTLEIGKAMNEHQGKERAATISNVLTAHGRQNGVVFHGYVTEKVLQSDKVKDTGYLVITDINDVDNKFILWYKNEIILAGRPGEAPSYMAPDSVCILPAYEGPMEISSIPDPLSTDDRLEVFLLVIQADDKIKTDKVIKSFEGIYKMFKTANDLYYDGDYIPWCQANHEATDPDDRKNNPYSPI